MLKNITLSADERLIEQARQRAQAESTTLNAEFRRWLAAYVEHPQSAIDFRTLMADLNGVQPGKTFNRDEMNER